MGDTIGYRIYYSGVSSGSEDVSSIIDNYLLTDLQTGGLYNISIVALATVSSQHLPSDTLEVTISLGKFLTYLLVQILDVRILIMVVCRRFMFMATMYHLVYACMYIIL